LDKSVFSTFLGLNYGSFQVGFTFPVFVLDISIYLPLVYNGSAGFSFGFSGTAGFSFGFSGFTLIGVSSLTSFSTLVSS
jgi:hypothetical protein